jgi:hypothetical protein
MNFNSNLDLLERILFKETLIGNAFNDFYQ